MDSLSHISSDNKNMHHYKDDLKGQDVTQHFWLSSFLPREFNVNVATCSLLAKTNGIFA